MMRVDFLLQTSTTNNDLILMNIERSNLVKVPLVFLAFFSQQIYPILFQFWQLKIIFLVRCLVMFSSDLPGSEVRL